MGIKTVLSLAQAQAIFPKRDFITLEATLRGVIDTTYVVSNQTQSFILKKYERATSIQIQQEQQLLKKLSKVSLQVPYPLESSQQWHLFTLIKGDIPHKITVQQLRSVGRFLGKLHSHTINQKSTFTPFKRENYQKTVKNLRKSNFYYAKQLSYLQYFPTEVDGIIHGDLFCDNSKFDGSILGVFDFIEAGNGSFAFDLGVVAMSWIGKKRLSRLQINILLQAYNQNINKKITLKKLLKMMHVAALVYTLKRLTNPLSPLDHQEMLLVSQKIQHFTKSTFRRKKC